MATAPERRRWPRLGAVCQEDRPRGGAAGRDGFRMTSCASRARSSSVKAAHGMAADHSLEDSLEPLLAVIPEDVELRSARMEEVSSRPRARRTRPSGQRCGRERTCSWPPGQRATFEALYRSIHRTADQPRPSAEKRPAVRSGSPWHARRGTRVTRCPCRIWRLAGLSATLGYGRGRLGARCRGR